ncbi:MAG: flagellar hook-associated protein FlgL, partial [Synergistaceae bacterium]|nr:flagellar hook-associated protein FlgL [Synergistaceae bacterium]
MTYRVTNSMMQSLLLNDMHANLGKLLDIQQQLSTQRKYQYASQNPHAVTKGMGLETMMSETEKYITNLQDAVSWLKFTDDALGDMNDLFVRIRELAVKGGDGALEGVDRVAIAEELRQIKEALMSIANSTMNGESLFAGLKTDTTPFSIGANGDVQYSGNNYALLWEFARQLTGKVSITGREVFPQDEVTNRLKGIEVPLDFEWTGRGEILEFNVGSTTVKVRIPEKWTDEIANGQTDSSDYNRYRDPGEPLEGWTLDDIANMINSSKEMGDVSKTLKATVVKDLDRGVQYLQIQSHTGAPVRLTGWPETDPIKVASGIKGAAYGAIGRTAAADGRIDVRFGDNQVYTVDVEQGETLAEIADKINTQPDGRIWASYKSDGTNEWIDFVAKNPDDYFNIETTGGATQIFAPEMATAVSAKDASSNQVVSSKIFDTTLPFESVSDGVITIRQGQYTYRVPVTGVLGASATQATISAAVNAAMNHYKTDPSDPNYNPALDITASVSGGALVLSSPGDEFSVTAEGGLAPLFSDGVSLSSNYKPDSDGKYSMDTGVIPSGFVLDT